MKKSHLTRFEEAIRAYFLTPQLTGFCSYFRDRYDGSGFYSGFMSFANKWPFAVRNVDGSLSSYIVPVSKQNGYIIDAWDMYDFDAKNQMSHKNPMRKELANFILRDIARKQKKKFVPIESF